MLTSNATCVRIFVGDPAWARLSRQVEQMARAFRRAFDRFRQEIEDLRDLFEVWARHEKERDRWPPLPTLRDVDDSRSMWQAAWNKRVGCRAREPGTRWRMTVTRSAYARGLAKREKLDA